MHCLIGLSSLVMWVLMACLTGLFSVNATLLADESSVRWSEQAVETVPQVERGRGQDVPRDAFVVAPGFLVEQLFVVPKATHGSWVSMTFDSQGRLIVSDQGDRGLFRVTLPAIGSHEKTRVEQLKTPLTAAQGMLYAFDSLYVSVNGGPGSGLYRLRDD